MSSENGWAELSLKKAGVSLLDCVHKTPPASETGYPYIAIPQIKDGRVELDGVRRITEAHFLEWTRKALPQAHDVILSRRCNPGETAYVRPGLQCAVGQNLVLLRADGSKVYPPFLRWLVRGRDWWNQVGAFINVGAVFESLKCADIPQFRLPIPPLDDQKTIASILGALDDKIELNRRTNETLEAMARAIFKSWFVDFDPVRAKLDGRQPPGMDAKTADLFPDHFEDSDCGHIPTGWNLCRLGDVVELKRGYDLPKKDRTPGPVPIYSSAGLTGFHSTSKVDGPTVITGRYGTIGKVFFVGGRSWPLNTTLYVRDFKGNEPRFVYHLLPFVNFDSYVDKAAVPGINRNHIHQEPTILPPVRVQQAFTQIVDPLWSRVVLNRSNTDVLSEIRDALLPKLLSGEIKVTDAKHVVEGVA